MNKIRHTSYPSLATHILQMSQRRLARLKGGSARITTLGLGLGISLILIIQGLGFMPRVGAQGRVSRPAAKQPASTKAAAGVATSDKDTVVTEQSEGGELKEGAQPPEKVLKPIERKVMDLGEVKMKELSNLKDLDPKQEKPIELKPINTPQDRPDIGRPGVAIPDDVKAQSKKPLAPSPSIPSPPVSRTFKSDNLSIGFIPPDTMGAVGLNHVVTTTNEKIIIHDRNGVIANIVTLDSFWAATPNGLPSPATFDPKILYDRFNDRFILISTANAQDPTSATLVATSTTGDPLGSWNRYAIDADATATGGGGAWADYPSVGFNKNWIVVSINRFGFGSVSGYQGPSIYVVNKTDAYAGMLGTVSVFESPFDSGCLALTPDQQPQALGCGFTYVPAITEDNLTGEEYLTEDWDSTAAQLRMTKITGSQASPALTVGYQFPQSPYSWRFNATRFSGSGGYVPQRQQNVYLPSGNRPTANDSRIQNAVLRNGSFWTVHHVMLARTQTAAGIDVGGTSNPDIRTAIQWWQINPTVVNPTSGTSPMQRNIIADPRADNCHNGAGGSRSGCAAANQKGDFYTFPTISVNVNNDVLIGYSRFSPFTLPKGAYSFRSGSDPLNSMRDSNVFREGQGNYNLSGGGNIRWGDYSSTMVDPANDTDFWTIQEYALDQRDVFFGAGVFHGLWSTWWGLIKPASTASYSYGSGVIISEFRLRGPAGARDEFVELVNPTNNAIAMTTTDGSDGWTLAYSNSAGTVTVLATIPNGTVIPAHGYYLITNEVRATGIAPYSLSLASTGNPVRTADSDAMWTPDNADNGGIALFRTANQANFPFAVVDAVGYAALPADSIYREGAGLPNCSGTANAQMSFVRKGGLLTPQDTGDNAADFDYVSANGASQTYVCQAPIMGNPTPCNLDAPPGGAGCTGLIMITKPEVTVERKRR